MGYFQHSRVFNSLDLAIMDRVYEAAWPELEARNPFRDREEDGERGETLRMLIMDQTGTDRVDFDTLFGRVVANMPETWIVFATPGSNAEVRA